jgi:hypothetical protein
MGMNPISIPQSPIKKKGGLFGAISNIVGGAVALGGAVAAPFTGGASLAAVPVGTGIMAGGGALGGAIDPAIISGGERASAINPMETAAKNKLSSDPRAQVAQLNESLSALKQSNNVKLQKAVEPFLVSARDRIMGSM